MRVSHRASEYLALFGLYSHRDLPPLRGLKVYSLHPVEKSQSPEGTKRIRFEVMPV